MLAVELERQKRNHFHAPTNDKPNHHSWFSTDHHDKHKSFFSFSFFGHKEHKDHTESQSSTHHATTHHEPHLPLEAMGSMSQSHWWDGDKKEDK
jgi:hypothetical protein